MIFLWQKIQDFFWGENRMYQKYQRISETLMKWPLRYKSWFLTILGFILSTKIPHSYPIIFNVTFGKKYRRQNILVMFVTIQNSHHLDNGTCTFNYSKMKFFCVNASSKIKTSVVYFQCMFKLKVRTLKLDKMGFF